MTQVQNKTNQQLNMVLAELMGYTVDKGRPGRVLKGNMSSMPTDYCNDPAASLEVQAKAIEVDAALYLKTLSAKVYGTTYANVEEYDLIALIEVKLLLLASPRERAEAAYITLSSKQ
ncbi:hypothetical protein BK125_04680 [Paenibacillus odorifer]|uniref:Uncharacterized protein n=1 Tax=Paenibacillus odorifer TaxID=189426 RepID=A0ABX3GCA4_9BACL|nr:hypothetical protein [Paenibacillus odorifer]OMC79579.1 hypothetical protein BK125_04680 [Paenibacillus odorifer]OMC96159.1 hypothetical protein BSO21_33580 [Paenibacillus odorifer]